MKTRSMPDLTAYKGKSQITLKTSYVGIRSIYRWSEAEKKYVAPTAGNKYVAMVKQHGRQREKHFESLNEAKRWRLSGDGLKNQAPKMLFEEVQAKFFERIITTVTPSTWKTYWNSTQHLCVFQKMKVSSITSQVIDQWLLSIKSPAYLESQHKTRFTYVKELKVLKLILRYYSEYEDESFIFPVKQRHTRDAVIDFQKMKAAKSRNQSRYLSNEEQARFLNELKVIAINEKRIFYYLACFQLLTGARIGELVALSWKDIDLIGDKFFISKSVSWGRGVGAKTTIQPFTKTGVDRSIPLAPFLISLLKEMNQDKGTRELIFSHDGHAPLAYRSIQYFYNKAFERAGIKHRSTHILRHTFSTDFLTDTKDHVSLSRLLGHSSTRQTEHYAKITGNLTNCSFETFKEGTEERLGKILKLG